MTSYFKILIKCATVHTISVCTWVWDLSSCCFTLFPQHFGIPISLMSSVYHRFLYMSIHFHFGLRFLFLSASNQLYIFFDYKLSFILCKCLYHTNPLYMTVSVSDPSTPIVLFSNFWFSEILMPQKSFSNNQSLKELSLALLPLLTSHVSDPYMEKLSMETTHNCLHHYYFITS